MIRTCCIILSAALLQVPAVAQDEPYSPDVIEFDGQSTLAFPSHASLDLSGGSTIEFWAQPDWTDAPDFDPVVLSYAGGESASYLVSLLRDRDGIGIMSGDRYEVVPFDFTDGKLHHVALIDYGDQTEVLIDDGLVAVLPMTIQSLPAEGLFIGTSDGANDPFYGALAALRLWGVPVSRDTVIEWTMRDVLSSDGPAHPDLPFLIGHSDFRNQDFLLAAIDATNTSEGN